MLRDLRYAARTLRKNPAFTMLALAALALGIGANSAIFSVVDAVLLAPLAYTDPAHLYEIAADDNSPVHGASLADFVDFRSHNRAFASLSVNHFWSFTLTGQSADAERVYAQALSADTLPLLGIAPALGRIFNDADFQPGANRVALLSDPLWRRRYSADPHVLGKTIQLDGESYIVVGVMPPQFQFPFAAYDVWTPWIFSPAELANHRDHGLTIYARLRPGVGPAQAQAELDSFAKATAAQFPDTEKDWHPRLGPTKLGSRDQYRTQLFTLLGAVGFVLLIACLNVANLLLARATHRQREIAVRIALGAGRWRIVRQLLAESLLLAGLGASLGLLLASWCAAILMKWLPISRLQIRLEYSGLNLAAVGFTAAIAIAAAVLFGLTPALQLSRADANRALRHGNRTVGGGFRGMLIVAETALSLTLLIGAGLMVRSFARLLQVNPGFRPENVLTVEVPMPSFLSAITSFASRKGIESRQAAEYADLIDHIRALPGVTSAAVSTVLPLGPDEVHTQVGYEGDPNPKQDHGGQLSAVSPDYFKAFGIPLLAGRAFTEADAAGAPDVAIVNDVLARRYWPNENPIGKHVNMSGLPQGPWYEVVGVAGAIHRRKLAQAPQPELYRPYRQYLGPAIGAFLAVRCTGDPASLGPAIRAQIRTLYPNQPIGDTKRMTDVVANSLALPRFYTALLAAFAALAGALAAAGIYGVMSYSVAQRTREVGIRMALGASAPSVVRLILRQGLSLVLAGVVLGVAGAEELTRLLRAELYDTSPSDPTTFAAVSLLLTGVAALAAWIPASRASRVDPMVALREE